MMDIQHPLPLAPTGKKFKTSLNYWYNNQEE